MPRKSANKSIAKKALSLAKRNAQLFKPEIKYRVLNNSQFGISYGGTVTNLLAITQGQSDTQRIGDSVRVIGMHINYFVEQATLIDYTSTAFDVKPHIIRVIVYKDKGNTVNTPGNYLQAVDSVHAPLQTKDHDNRMESVSKYDKSHVVTALTPTRHTKQFIRFGKMGMKVQYQGGGTTVNQNNLKLLLISNQVGTNTAVNFFAHIKIYYFDA